MIFNQRRNKYDMWDADTGEQLFFAQENDIGDGGCQGYCIRGCFKGHREAEIPLQMAVNDVNAEYGGKGKYHLSKARAIGLYPCQCGCCATCEAACMGCCGLCPRDACCGTCWIEKGLARLSSKKKMGEFLASSMIFSLLQGQRNPQSPAARWWMRKG